MWEVDVGCCFMEPSTSTHMKVIKRILHYLIDFGLFYSPSNKFETMGFCDNTFAGDMIVLLLEILRSKLLREFNMNQEESTKIYIDNKSTQVLAKNLVFHEQSNYIGMRCEATLGEDTRLSCRFFTKPLKFEDFTKLEKDLNVKKRFFEFSNYGNVRNNN
ncbi:hypothetical protein CR513_46339, partial [Mucuna pruriens]